MRKFLTVFLKEAVDNLRDRRTLFTVLVFGPLFGPLFYILMMNTMINREVADYYQPLKLPVAGAERAPGLMEYLRQHNTEIEAAPADPRAAVKQGKTDVVLVIPPEYAEQFRDGKPAALRLVLDQSRDTGRKDVRRARELLDDYARTVGALRLIARGVDPRAEAPLAVEEDDQSTPQSRAVLVLAMMPYFFLFAAILGAFYLAIDTTAGERERGSLEPLLINPVPRDRILLGKVLATALFGLASLTLGLLAFMVAGWFLPGDQIGLSFNLGPHVVGATLPLMLPLVLLIAVTEILVTAFAKSAREAQAHLALVQILPAITSVVLSFAPIKSALWMYVVPLLSQQLIILRLLRGEPIAALAAALSVVFTLVAVLVVFWAARRSYATERLAISS